MSGKTLAASVAAIVMVGPAAGVMSFESVYPAPAHAQPAVLGAPPPPEPAADVPTPGGLIVVLNGVEGRFADRALQKAARRGSLPLSFNVSNITPAGPGAASADVTASGPTPAPTTPVQKFRTAG